MTGARRVVAALDKFRGTLSAAQACQAVADGCWPLGLDCDGVPLADGGEGLLEAPGGANRATTVTGPLGTVPALATPSAHGGDRDGRGRGLQLAGGADGNDPLLATTRGVGELLLVQAIDQGARTVIVGLGGSATTDGGLGALQALPSTARLEAVELQVACDVRTRFVDAAAVFAPQKGASPAQVAMLTTRLRQLVERYRDEYGVDVSAIDGGGAAGGLAGGLVAVGGVISPGFDLVADHVDLAERIAAADVVVTGEGYLDAQSLDGKVVGGARTRRRSAALRSCWLGDADDDVVGALRAGDGPGCVAVTVATLIETFGPDRPFTEPSMCLTGSPSAPSASCSAEPPSRSDPVTGSVVTRSGDQTPAARGGCRGRRRRRG